MYKYLLLLNILLFTNCFKAKKAPFDLSKPSFGFSIIFRILNSGSSSSSQCQPNQVLFNNFCNTIQTTSIYPKNQRWNDYIKNDGQDMFSASDTICTGAETGGHKACLHSGELKKIELINKSSCSDLTIQDSLNAFNWICRVLSNKVFFYSTGFNEGKYLSDLIDFTEVKWKRISVTIFEKGKVIVKTSEETWWSNEILLNRNSVSESYKIYIYTQNLNHLYISAVNNISIIGKPDTILTTGSSCTAITMYIETSNFVMIEGRFNFGNGNVGLHLNNSRFSSVRNFSTQDTNRNCATGTGSSIYLFNVTNSYFEKIRISNVYNLSRNSSGFDIFNSDNNIFLNSNISNISQNGLRLTGSSRNTFINIYIQHSAGSGILLSSTSNDNYFSNLTVTNGNSNGIELISGGRNLFSNLAIIGNGSLASQNNLSLQTNGNTFQNITFTGAVTTNINLNNSSNNYFTGNFKSSNCTVTGGTNPGLGTTTCALNGSSDFNYNGNTSTISISTGTVFIDRVTTNDTSNNSDTNGIATFSAITDWNNFDNPARSWGRNDTVFPLASANRGYSDTLAGTSRIFDWSLKTSDAQLRNINPCPNQVQQFNSADQNTILHYYSTSSVTFLRNAVEILNDGVGDEDGLCEANERCLFTPNMGAYQGHGNIIPAQTSSSTTLTCRNDPAGGTLTGISLFKQEVNGY
jgi:hypothetical protein